MDKWCRAPGCSSHTHPASLFQAARGGWGAGERERGREDVYHAVELPASQLVCLSPSLRPETERGRDIGGGSTASFFPSLLSSLPPSLPLLAPIFPSSTLAFIFLVFACPLKAKGLCALYVNACVVWNSQTASGWCIHSACEFPPSASSFRA